MPSATVTKYGSTSFRGETRSRTPERTVAAADQCPRGIARLLLPQSDYIKSHCHDRRSLDDLDKEQLPEVGQDFAEDEPASHHSEQQHDIEKCNDPRSRLFRCEIGRECKPRRLRGVYACANEQECERRGDIADPNGTICVARQNDQRKRHNRQATKLKKRAEPKYGTRRQPSAEK